MSSFEFILKFALRDACSNPEEYVESLYENGCDDALIGIGQAGRIALAFNRVNKNASNAVFSAIKDVNKVIPGAILLQVSPDLVGLTDIAELLGLSRQNIRKLMINHARHFPLPVHDGSTTLWHLDDVLRWFEDKQSRDIAANLIELAKVSRQINLARAAIYLDPEISKRYRALGIARF